MPDTDTKTHRKAPQDRKRKKPLRRKLTVILDDDVLLDFQRAELDLGDAKLAYDAWEGGQRELQILALSRMDPELQREFLVTLPDVPGAEQRRAAVKSREEALSAAREALVEQSVDLWFRSIGRKAYDALIDEHQPTDEHNAEHLVQTGAPAPYNLDTFPKALVGASCENLNELDEDLDEIWDAWNANELTEMFTAALMVNTFRRTVQLGNG